MTSWMNKLNNEFIQMKDVTHAHTRLELTDTQTATVEAIWGAFNSIVTEENIPEKVVGFLPVLPHPGTDHKTAFTTMHNLLNVLNQLGQSYLPVMKAFFTQFHHP